MSQGRLIAFHSPSLPRDPRAHFNSETTPLPVHKDVALRAKYARIVATKISIRLGDTEDASEVRAMLGLPKMGA